MTPVDGSAPARLPRNARDIVRLGVACSAGIGSALVTFVIVFALYGGRWHGDIAVLCLFAFSGGWSISYLVHTLRVFGRLDSDGLRDTLRATNPDGRMGRLGAILSGTGPTIAVQWSVIAIAAVLVFTLWPGLESDPVTVIFSILVVGASWAVTLVAYAVHYARYDVAAGGIEFPGKGHERLFSDYVYLAAQVQTTFSTSDVSLTLAGPRRLVTGHTLVSFAFNTVIIAMLITVLFLGG